MALSSWVDTEFQSPRRHISSKHLIVIELLCTLAPLVLVRDTVRRHFIKCEALRSYSTACWTCATILSCRSSSSTRFRFSPPQSHLQSHLLQECGFPRGRSQAGATGRFELILCYGGALLAVQTRPSRPPAPSKATTKKNTSTHY